MFIFKRSSLSVLKEKQGDIKMKKTVSQIPVSRVLCRSMELRYELSERVSGDDTSVMVSGSERALIVIRDTFGDLREAYSVVGSFRASNLSTGNIEFQREQIQWSDEDVRQVLESGNIVDVLVRINKNGRVKVDKRFDEGAFYKTIPLEDYLLNDRDAFPKLRENYSRAKKKLEFFPTN